MANPVCQFVRQLDSSPSVSARPAARRAFPRGNEGAGVGRQEPVSFVQGLPNAYSSPTQKLRGAPGDRKRSTGPGPAPDRGSP